MGRLLFVGANTDFQTVEYGRLQNGFIYPDGDEAQILHEKAAKLNEECYLDDWAAEMNDDYFNGTLDISSIKFSQRQGKATLGMAWKNSGRVILSFVLAHHAYIESEVALEYMIMHEIAHLECRNHGAGFWRVVRRNPNAEAGHWELFGKEMPYAGR